MSITAVYLAKAGFILFTIGLLIGFAIPWMRNSRMALSAHLTAAQTGPALIAVALVWNYLAVPETWSPALTFGLILSSYLLVAGISFAAIFGASQALPIAGEGYVASKAKELAVTIMVRGSSLLMALVCITVSFFALTNFGGVAKP